MEVLVLVGAIVVVAFFIWRDLRRLDAINAQLRELIKVGNDRYDALLESMMLMRRDGFSGPAPGPMPEPFVIDDNYDVEVERERNRHASETAFEQEVADRVL